MSDTEIDTTNKFLVSSQGDNIVFIRPVPQRISQQDALLLAAYLVSMVCNEDQWQATLQAVQSV